MELSQAQPTANLTRVSDPERNCASVEELLNAAPRAPQTTLVNLTGSNVEETNGHLWSSSKKPEKHLAMLTPADLRANPSPATSVMITKPARLTALGLDTQENPYGIMDNETAEVRSVEAVSSLQDSTENVSNVSSQAFESQKDSREADTATSYEGEDSLPSSKGQASLDHGPSQPELLNLHRTEQSPDSAPISETGQLTFKKSTEKAIAHERSAGRAEVDTNGAQSPATQSYEPNMDRRIRDIVTVFTGKRLFRLAKKAYVILNSEDLDGRLVDIWNEEIEIMLQERLGQDIELRDRRNDRYIPDLKLAGKSPSSMRPTIVIWCTNHYILNQVRSKVKTYSNLLSYDIPVMAYVDEIRSLGSNTLVIASLTVSGSLLALVLGTLLVLWRRRNAAQRQSYSIPATNLNQNRIMHWIRGTQSAPPENMTDNESGYPMTDHVSAKYPLTWDGTSMSKVLVKLTDPARFLLPETPQGTPLEIYPAEKAHSVHQCTLGGVLCIYDRFYGFTVGHVLLTSDGGDLKERLAAAHKDPAPMSVTESKTLWEASLFVHVTDSEGVNMDDKPSDDGVDATDDPQNDPERLDAIAAGGPSDIIMGRSESTAASMEYLLRVSHYNSAHNKDYMIFDVTDIFKTASRRPHCSIVVSSSRKETFSGTIKDPFPKGRVTVHTGFSGSLVGELSKTLTSIRTKDGAMRVRQIVLTSPLRPGDSGSWVWHGGLAYGYVVAGHKTLPLAYMRPIDETLVEILEARQVPVTLSQYVTDTGAMARYGPQGADFARSLPISELEGSTVVGGRSTKTATSRSAMDFPESYRSKAPKEGNGQDGKTK